MIHDFAWFCISVLVIDGIVYNFILLIACRLDLCHSRCSFYSTYFDSRSQRHPCQSTESRPTTGKALSNLDMKTLPSSLPDMVDLWWKHLPEILGFLAAFFPAEKYHCAGSLQRVWFHTSTRWNSNFLCFSFLVEPKWLEFMRWWMCVNVMLWLLNMIVKTIHVGW